MDGRTDERAREQERYRGLVDASTIIMCGDCLTTLVICIVFYTP